jgi:hypothetical protein
VTPKTKGAENTDTIRIVFIRCIPAPVESARHSSDSAEADPPELTSPTAGAGGPPSAVEAAGAAVEAAKTAETDKNQETPFRTGHTFKNGGGIITDIVNKTK